MHWIAKKTLSKILKNCCESRIPRSGNSGRKVNCFVVSIDNNSAPYLLVQSLEDESFRCLEWDNDHYSIERNIDLKWLNLKELVIIHYYGLATIQYNGLIDYLINQALFLPYIKIHTKRILEYTNQFHFNKKKLVTKQRNELLKLLLELSLEGESKHSPPDLMSGLYSLRWVLHPDGERVLSQLEFHLDALVDTGELARSGGAYVLTGFGVRAITEYEEQERKHTENVKMQSRTLWLTTIITLLTLIQAGLIKLPTLIDLSTP